MNKYLGALKAERQLEEQNLIRLSQQAAQHTSQWKAEIAAAEKELVADHTSSRPFSREHRAAGDKFVAAWLQMFGAPPRT